MNSELEVALVVERHRGDLAERVFSVEHPAVGAGEQGVCNVANTVFRGTVWFCGRAGTLYPLAAEILRNFAASEVAVPSVLNFDAGPADGGVGIEERDPLLITSACRATLNAGGH